jgi:hypothetical protein
MGSIIRSHQPRHLPSQSTPQAYRMRRDSGHRAGQDPVVGNTMGWFSGRVYAPCRTLQLELGFNLKKGKPGRCVSPVFHF